MHISPSTWNHSKLWTAIDSPRLTLLLAFTVRKSIPGPPLVYGWNITLTHFNPNISGQNMDPKNKRFQTFWPKLNLIIKIQGVQFCILRGRGKYASLVDWYTGRSLVYQILEQWAVYSGKKWKNGIDFGVSHANFDLTLVTSTDFVETFFEQFIFVFVAFDPTVSRFKVKFKIRS